MNDAFAGSEVHWRLGAKHKSRGRGGPLSISNASPTLPISKDMRHREMKLLNHETFYALFPVP